MVMRAPLHPSQLSYWCLVINLQLLQQQMLITLLLATDREAMASLP